MLQSPRGHIHLLRGPLFTTPCLGCETQPLNSPAAPAISQPKKNYYLSLRGCGVVFYSIYLFSFSYLFVRLGRCCNKHEVIYVWLQQKMGALCRKWRER